jgi:hypothetical protein
MERLFAAKTAEERVVSPALHPPALSVGPLFLLDHTDVGAVE